ncbi:uncharacterized protein LOC135943970 [Cloeon dipterum]|uniref:uncharacterized protein LOC135943970 n=1 Tax=Cloeon dipterum TaxID=197152 RepID=UPI0032205B8F
MSKRQNKSTLDESQTSPRSGNNKENKKSRPKKPKDADNLEALRAFMSRNGKLYSVSRLFHVDFSEVSIKRYKKIIRERVKGVLISKTGTDYKVEATFEVQPELGETSHDHSSVFIQVSVIPPSQDEDGDDEYLAENAKTMYSGYLTCRGRDKAYASVSQLPLLLAFARTVTLSACINSTLQVLFDCIIRPLELSTQEMELLFTQCLAATTRDDSKIALGLNFPCFKKDDVIELALSSENFPHLKKLVKTRQQSSDMAVSKKLFDKLYQSLNTNLSMDLQSCTLIKFQLSNIVLHNSGKFLVSSTAVMATFLKSLCHICLQKEIRLLRDITDIVIGED